MQLSAMVYDKMTKPLNIVKDNLQKYFKGRCLDIGCNSGRHLKLMPKESYGLDIEKQVIPNYNFTQFNLNRGYLPYGDKRFDCILFSHVIEHIESPSLIIKECHRILKKEGILIVAIPNIHSIRSDFYSDHCEGHINVWSRKTFKKFLLMHNFNVLNIYSNYPKFLRILSDLPFNFFMEDIWFICEGKG